MATSSDVESKGLLDGRQARVPRDAPEFERIATALHRPRAIAVVALSLIAIVLVLGARAEEDQSFLGKVKKQINSVLPPMFDPSDEDWNEEDIGDPIELEVDDKVLKKTRWHKARIVFVAGLSESGHEAWKTALKRVCGKRSPETGKTTVCKPMCATASAGFSYPESIKNFRKKLAAAELEFQEISANVENDPNHDTIYFVNYMQEMCNGPTHNDMQYPPSQLWKAGSIPDFPLMASLAEKFRVDFRVVVLSNSGNIVAKTKELVSMYHWYAGMGSAKTVETMLNAIYSQVKLVDKAFLFGMDMSTYTGDYFAGSLENFVGIPGLEKALAKPARDYQLKEKKLSNQYVNNGDDPMYSYEKELQIANNQIWNFLYPGKAREPSFVPKTVWSDDAQARPTLLFFAGLEGTGHHLWSIASQLAMEKGELVPACDLSKALYEKADGKTLWQAYNLDEYQHAKKKVSRRLEELVKSDDGQGKVYLGNLMHQIPLCQAKAGMMSYPNFSGRYKTVTRPNLVTLAAMCEQAGIDLRVIFLSRDPRNIIRSTVDNRHFGGYGPQGEPHEIAHLTANMYTLNGQLAGIDKDFISFCFDEENHDLQGIENLGPATRVPHFPDFVRSKAAFKDVHADEKDAMKFEKKNRERKTKIGTFIATMHSAKSLCPLA